MSLWLLVTLVLIVQETLSTNFVLFHAVSEDFPLSAVHLIFIVGTLLDILVGFSLAKVLQKWLSNWRSLSSWSSRISSWVKLRLGNNVERCGLFAMGTLAQPYITAFVGSWLGIRFIDVVVVAFLSDLIWYIYTLVLVFSARSFLPPKYALVGLVCLTVLLLIAMRLIRARRS